MASFAARAILRSCSVTGRNAATRLGGEARAARSPFRVATKPLSQRAVRFPVELSFCVESMLPFHSATSSALMTSLLSLSRCSYGWLPQEDLREGSICGVPLCDSYPCEIRSF